LHPTSKEIAMIGFSFKRLLATVTLALAGSVFAAPHGPGMMMFGGQGMSRMLEQVNASAEQRSQIEQIMKAARSDLQAQREAGRALREQSMQLFAQPTVDAAAAEALRQQMLAQHDRASQRMLQAMLEVSRVLTPEQRQQIAEQIKQRTEGMRRQPGQPRGERAPRS
jgi:periplasmic protein CpxP/Spy